MARYSISRLALSDFRSFAHLELRPERHLTVLVGSNGVGKTNVIEAIQLVTAAASFRRPSWTDLVRWGAAEAVIRVEMAEDHGGRRAVEMRASGAGRRSYSVDGAAVRRVSDIRGRLPAVLFTPDDLRMVKEAPERRRAALDEVGVQLSAAYSALKNEFEATLRQRNALLREESADEAELEAWTERLVDTGSRFAARRRALFERIRRHAEDAYPRLAGGEGLTARYEVAWDTQGAREPADLAAEMRCAVTSRRSEERARRTTLVGPHRDDVVFEIDGHDARVFGSQGQQRTVALAWKFGEVLTVREVGEGDPVLLLDDVMSELDEDRRAHLGAMVHSTAQTILTTTDLEHLEKRLVSKANVVRLG